MIDHLPIWKQKTFDILQLIVFDIMRILFGFFIFVNLQWNMMTNKLSSMPILATSSLIRSLQSTRKNGFHDSTHTHTYTTDGQYHNASVSCLNIGNVVEKKNIIDFSTCQNHVCHLHGFDQINNFCRLCLPALTHFWTPL